MATCHEKSRLLLSFFPFFSRAHTRKSQWVVTVTKYRSAIAAAHYIHTLLHTMLHIYSVLMLTKQEDSLLIIISRLRGSLIISRLSPRTKACFDWIDDSGSEQSESSINSDHARLVTAAVITEFYARVCVRRRCPAWDACWPQIWSGSSAASSEKLDTRCEPLLLSMLH